MKVSKPNAIVYFFVYIFLMPFLKIYFRLEVDKSNYKPPKGPFLVVCNHGSFMDFVVTMLSIYPIRLNAVAAQKFFYYKPLHWFLPMMGAIPKALFDADMRSIMGIKKVLARGGKVLLYPEGRCECDGVYAGMHTATGKLIKKLAVPVISCSIDGAYNCMPFWRRGIRPGRVRIIISNLFSYDDLKRLTADDICKVLDKRLSRIEDPPPRKKLGTTSKKQLAEGLENILYWCPKCAAEFTTQTKDCEIFCTSCGYTAKLDGYMDFTSYINGPSSLHEWFKLQARYEASKLHDDMNPVRVNVHVRLPSEIPGGGMDTCGNGTICLKPDGWYFDGEIRGETQSLRFPIHAVPALPIDPDDVFQIYSQGIFYCFVPERTREVIKYSVIGECAYWKFTDDIYMTPRRDSGFC